MTTRRLEREREGKRKRERERKRAAAVADGRGWEIERIAKDANHAKPAHNLIRLPPLVPSSATTPEDDFLVAESSSIPQ